MKKKYKNMQKCKNNLALSLSMKNINININIKLSSVKIFYI